ncbi:protein FREE1 isoform X1 [Sesbania bispinosa]|nr:protein FREE1 isoform X1 [Sesbania bispinosa]
MPPPIRTGPVRLETEPGTGQLARAFDLFDHARVAQKMQNYPPRGSNAVPGFQHFLAMAINHLANSSFHQPAPIYAPSNPNPPYSDAPSYAGAYLDDGYGSRSDLYGKRRDEVYSEGVFAYKGGKVEPYGAWDTAPKSSIRSGFDDYGRSISFPSGPATASKVRKAVPKVDAQEDNKSGVQKFRVKLLAESGGQSTMDVLCQIGLDGIRMLYPLENVTRCEKFDSSTIAFWSKSSVDIEPRRIRLQCNSYTANMLLDTVTAATIQVFGELHPSCIEVIILLIN